MHKAVRFYDFLECKIEYALHASDVRTDLASTEPASNSRCVGRCREATVDTSNAQTAGHAKKSGARPLAANLKRCCTAVEGGVYVVDVVNSTAGAFAALADIEFDQRRLAFA
jgi:hypothetical protein